MSHPFIPDPPAPDGYIFVTNHSRMTLLNKTINTVKRCNEICSKQLSIPIEDFLTLENVVPDTAFTTYVKIEHKDVVESWRKHIFEMFEKLLEKAKIEEYTDEVISNFDDNFGKFLVKGLDFKDISNRAKEMTEIMRIGYKSNKSPAETAQLIRDSFNEDSTSH